MSRKSVYCPSLKACTACEDWVQELARGTASVGLPGALWAHKRDAVLKVAADVRAAFPDITFGGVDLPEAGKRKASPPPPRRSKKARKETGVAAEPAPPARSSGRARSAPKKMGA